MNIVNISTVCNIEIGKTPARKNSSYWGKGNKWVSISDMKNKYINKTREEITDFAIEDCNMKLVPKNTVIMSFKLSVGKVSITSDDMYTNEAIAAFHIKPEEQLSSEYLYYALQTLRLNQNANRAVMGLTLNKKELQKLRIPLPPLQIQKKIVEVLDKAQEFIDLRKKQIELLDDLIESIFYDMFGDPVINPKGWEKIILKDIAEINMGQSPKSDTYNSKSIGTPLLNGPTEFGDINPLEKQWTTFPTKIAIKGDILICVRGATTGRLNIADKKYCIGRGLASIRLKDNLYFDFIYLYLKLRYDYFQNIGTGSTFINIKKSQLEDLELILPPIELQNEFAEKVEKIEEEKELMQESLIEMENNFKSLMQKAFRGELFN